MLVRAATKQMKKSRILVQLWVQCLKDENHGNNVLNPRQNRVTTLPLYRRSSVFFLWKNAGVSRPQNVKQHCADPKKTVGAIFEIPFHHPKSSVDTKKPMTWTSTQISAESFTKID